MNAFSFSTKSVILITQHNHCLQLWPVFLGHSQFNEQNTKIHNLLKPNEMNTCSVYLCDLCVTGDDDDPVAHVGTGHLWQWFVIYHHHFPEALGMLSCSLILKMKLVRPSLPQSSYVSSSFWFSKKNSARYCHAHTQNFM